MAVDKHMPHKRARAAPKMKIARAEKIVWNDQGMFSSSAALNTARGSRVGNRYCARIDPALLSVTIRTAANRLRSCSEASTRQRCLRRQIAHSASGRAGNANQGSVFA